MTFIKINKWFIFRFILIDLVWKGRNKSVKYNIYKVWPTGVYSQGFYSLQTQRFKTYHLCGMSSRIQEQHRRGFSCHSISHIYKKTEGLFSSGMHDWKLYRKHDVLLIENILFPISVISLSHGYVLRNLPWSLSGGVWASETDILTSTLCSSIFCFVIVLSNHGRNLKPVNTWKK